MRTIESSAVIDEPELSGCRAPDAMALRGTDDAEHECGVHHELLLRTDKSWDGTPYVAYPCGQPELCIEKITIAPGTVMTWHTHVAPVAAYVLQGTLTVERLGGEERVTVVAGQVLPEMVGPAHRGVILGDEAVILIVFHAAAQGLPLARAAHRESPRSTPAR